MQDSTEELIKKVAHYEKLFAVAQNDLSYKAYLSFVKIVEQQVDYIDTFKIANIIADKKTESPQYERAESIWSNLPKLISSLNNLKAELKIEFDPNDGKPKFGPTSPQSIGRNV